jgi:phospholipid/cholesterol/gamma-HCH transport system substrate-binding protein
MELAIVSHAPNRVARIAALVALPLAVALVALVLLSGGSKYQVRLLFSDASGLVSGDPVLVGPAQVGEVGSTSLTANGLAAIEVSLSSGAAPLHRGTVARIEENGLAGIASHYITLQPASNSAPTIPSGGTIGTADTHAEVGLDELFDAFDSSTRGGIRGLIQGFANSLKGRAGQANSSLHYLDPALASSASVTAELTKFEPAFDNLLVSGARTMQALASRSQQLTQLVSSTATASSAIASQSQALGNTLTALPGTLARSSSTLATVRQTLTALNPVVAAAKPAVRQLPQFATALDQLEQVATPTVGALVSLVDTGGLTGVLRDAPALASVAKRAFPALVRSMNASQSQLDYLREYTPDVVSAFADLGQAGAYYDANGHYTRVQPWFNAFSVNSSNQLVERAPADRYDGLEFVHDRCPGSAVQPTPDGSAPWAIPGCSLSSTPPGA